MKAVEIKKEGKFTRAEIITDGEVSDYNVFDLKSPNRVVVDVRNAREISTKGILRLFRLTSMAPGLGGMTGR